MTPGRCPISPFGLARDLRADSLAVRVVTEGRGRRSVVCSPCGRAHGQGGGGIPGGTGGGDGGVYFAGAGGHPL